VRTVLSGLFGTVTVDGAQWQRMVLRPRLMSGRFDAVFDIELFIDDKGRFRDRGWDFDTARRGFESALRKIHYLQYGKPDRPEDPLYVRLGALEGVTLGYGLIVSDYRNTLDDPGVKKTGLDVSVRDISAWGVGIRAIVSDVMEASRGGALLGLRLSARPLFRPSENESGRLEVGLTVVSDTDQYEGLRSLPLPTRPAGDGIGMVGIDAAYPIWERDHLQLILYGQAARVVDRNGIRGDGFGAPGALLTLGPLRMKGEYRRFSHQFRPQYFNDLYEKTRARYDASRGIAIPGTAALADTAMSGFCGDAKLILGPVMAVSASYEFLSGMGNATSQRLLARAALSPPLLKRVPYLGQASVYYEKYNIDTRKAGFFRSTPDTFYGYLVGIDIARDVSVVWDTRYTFGTDAAGLLRRHKVLNIQAVTRF
jgi:hypothetical protein